jgi:hypothetical protein
VLPKLPFEPAMNGIAQAPIPTAAPEVDLRRVQRIWPVVLSAGMISQTEMLWSYVRGQSTGMPAQAKVQPVTLLDPQDFEQQMGLSRPAAT